MHRKDIRMQLIHNKGMKKYATKKARFFEKKIERKR